MGRSTVERGVSYAGCCECKRTVFKGIGVAVLTAPVNIVVCANAGVEINDKQTANRSKWLALLVNLLFLRNDFWL
jgi:hypothetical protein